MIEEEEEERNKDCGAETDLLLEGRALVLAPSPFCLPIPMRRFVVYCFVISKSWETENSFSAALVCESWLGGVVAVPSFLSAMPMLW